MDPKDTGKPVLPDESRNAPITGSTDETSQEKKYEQKPATREMIASPNEVYSFRKIKQYWWHRFPTQAL